MSGVEIPPELTRVLVVTAHPDDVDFGSAGTVATLVAGRGRGHLLHRHRRRRRRIRPRRARARRSPGSAAPSRCAAAAVVGVTDVRFLGYRDGELTVSHDLRRDISPGDPPGAAPARDDACRPVRNWERIAASHPDHMAAGEATVQAIYPDARNQFAHPTLLTTRASRSGTSRSCGCWARPTPNTYVDVTDKFDAQARRAARAREPDRAHGGPRGDDPRLDDPDRAAAAGCPRGAWPRCSTRSRSAETAPAGVSTGSPAFAYPWGMSLRLRVPRRPALHRPGRPPGRVARPDVGRPPRSSTAPCSTARSPSWPPAWRWSASPRPSLPTTRTSTT